MEKCCGFVALSEFLPADKKVFLSLKTFCNILKDCDYRVKAYSVISNMLDVDNLKVSIGYKDDHLYALGEDAEYPSVVFLTNEEFQKNMRWVRPLTVQEVKSLKGGKGFDPVQMVTPPKSKDPWTAMTKGSTGGWAKPFAKPAAFLPAVASLAAVPFTGGGSLAWLPSTLAAATGAAQGMTTGIWGQPGAGSALRGGLAGYGQGAFMNAGASGGFQKAYDAIGNWGSGGGSLAAAGGSDAAFLNRLTGKSANLSSMAMTPEQVLGPDYALAFGANSGPLSQSTGVNSASLNRAVNRAANVNSLSGQTGTNIVPTGTSQGTGMFDSITKAFTDKDSIWGKVLPLAAQYGPGLIETPTPENLQPQLGDLYDRLYAGEGLTPLGQQARDTLSQYMEYGGGENFDAAYDAAAAKMQENYDQYRENLKNRFIQAGGYTGAEGYAGQYQYELDRINQMEARDMANLAASMQDVYMQRQLGAVSQAMDMDTRDVAQLMSIGSALGMENQIEYAMKVKDTQSLRKTLSDAALYWFGEDEGKQVQRYIQPQSGAGFEIPSGLPLSDAIAEGAKKVGLMFNSAAELEQWMKKTNPSLYATT